mgnify:CR=1 FL=1
MSFSNLQDKSQYFRDNPQYAKTKDGMIDLICRDCEFWKEDDRDYECGSFKLMKMLIEKDVLSAEEIINAASE